MENNLKKLEQTIGYQFTAKSLLEQAMTHSSYANEKHLGKLGCNERLEFLGDAVLELISSDFLYKKFRNNQEGELTKKRASMVCEKSLAYCAREFGLPEFILLGRGEEMMGGRKRDSIVSDALESLIGAMYLDGGFEPAQAFVMKFKIYFLCKGFKSLHLYIFQIHWPPAVILYCVLPLGLQPVLLPFLYGQFRFPYFFH